MEQPWGPHRRRGLRSALGPRDHEAPIVLARIGGWRSVAFRTEPDGAAVTLVDREGAERILLRIAVEAGRPTTLELL